VPPRNWQVDCSSGENISGKFFCLEVLIRGWLAGGRFEIECAVIQVRGLVRTNGRICRH